MIRWHDPRPQVMQVTEQQPMMQAQTYQGGNGPELDDNDGEISI